MWLCACSILNAKPAFKVLMATMSQTVARVLVSKDKRIDTLRKQCSFGESRVLERAREIHEAFGSENREQYYPAGKSSHACRRLFLLAPIGAA